MLVLAEMGCPNASLFISVFFSDLSFPLLVHAQTLLAFKKKPGFVFTSFFTQSGRMIYQKTIVCRQSCSFFLVNCCK